MPRGIPHSVFLGWDTDDRDKALWWLIHQRQACPSCGLRPEVFEDDLHAYVAEPYHCRGCEIQAQGDEWLERRRKESRRGTRMRLVPADLAAPPAEP